ncbi:MAG: polysaccharide deacetylase family protein, partial [bacterium]|nr:polysaccharide deacetylase family protein [bacterium]
TPHPEVAAFWEEAGGVDGAYGAPVGEPACTEGSAGETCWQRYENGTIRWREGVGVIDCAVLECVALTFDDGPAPDTPGLLDFLVDRNVQATFYVVGNRIDGFFGDVMPRYAEAGMELGNHSWDHADLRTLSAEALAQQVRDTNARIVERGGIAPRSLRPPFGSRNAQVDGAAGQEGLYVVNWSGGPADWEPQSVQSMIDRTLASTVRGSVILLHDLNPKAVEAVPGILDGLEAAGYTLVTVEDMFGPMEPGAFVAAGAGN